MSIDDQIALPEGDDELLDEDLEDLAGDMPMLPRGTDRTVMVGAAEDHDDDDDEADEAIGDDVIAARVRRLLRSDSATNMLRIRVLVEDGVVTLLGRVQTLEDTDIAAEVASRVQGVIDVVDELEVED